MDRNGLTRRQFLEAGLGTLAGTLARPSLAAVSASGPDGKGRPPNVVIIFADQLRACSVGCYGNSEVDTPNVDLLAAEGALFFNAVATSPLSAPFRACLMTGRYPNKTGVTKNSIKLPHSEVGIAEVFANAGYQTKFIGKWFLNGPTQDPVTDPGWVPPWARQGFDKWAAFNGGHIYYESKYYVDDDPSIHQTNRKTYEPDFQTDTAIRFIRENRSQSFLLVMSIGTPHPPNRGRDLPPGGAYTFPYDPQSMTLRPNVDYPDLDYARQEYADYYGMISNIDWNLGRILEALDRFRLDRRTIVVFASDHGDYVGSHYATLGGFRGKSVIFSESLDIPFVLRYPTAIAPIQVSQVFSAVDMMPTLLGLCRLRIPRGVMGRDFSPLLIAGQPPANPPYGPVPSTESAFVHMLAGPFLWLGVRTQEYTLECDLVTYLPTRLYHNAVDPYQMTNLVDDPAYDSIKANLHKQTLSWVNFVQLDGNQY